MLHRLTRRNEDGQGLWIVVAIIAISAILLTALEVAVVGDAQLAATSTTQEQALQAADSGLADYQTWINHSASQWQYAMNFCSSGTFPGGAGQLGCLYNAAGQTRNTPPNPNNNPPAANPDPNNAAFSGIATPTCALPSGAPAVCGSPGAISWGCQNSTYSATSPGSAAGSANYYGWVTLHGSTTGGFAEQFQYVVDSSLATPLGGYVHVFITGRAGTSGHYVCSTVKALYSGPKLTSVNTVQLSPATCTGQTIPVIAPNTGTTVGRVLIEATGGKGQTGGSGGLSVGGGSGGVGETVEATYAATNTTTLYVTLGCQGGSNTGITAAGKGFSPGGSVGGGNAGGGGGSTAVCSVNPCKSPNVGTANLASNLYVLAAGGGGGGEGLFGATAAGGGAGVKNSVTPVTSGMTESGSNGSNATAWFQINGGTGGAGAAASAAWSPTGGNGQSTNALFDADGGAGGGGYAGGTGGNIGFGGGGGGAGSSFYNTSSTGGGANGIGAFVTGATATGFYSTTGTATPSYPPPTYGSVTIQWQDASGNPIGTPVIPANCGPIAEQTQQIPALAQVSMQVNGASGGDGSSLGYLDFSNAGSQGDGATTVATYQNTSTSPVDITAIQGCEGSIGNSSGNLAGGDGLRSSGAVYPNLSGGANCLTCSPGQGDAGSGGGATAICVGTVDPGMDSAGTNNCTSGAPDVLMVAGAGGAGGGVDVLLAFCSGGNGADAGVGLSPTFSPTTGLVTSSTITTGNVAGNSGTVGSCSGANGGSGGSTTYGPTGTNGNQANSICPSTVGGGGDGGPGGGGYDGGGAGDAGPLEYLFGFIPYCNSSAGGGGGSSYLSSATGPPTPLAPSGVLPSANGTCAGANGGPCLQLAQCGAGGRCLYSACPGGPTQPNPGANQVNSTASPINEAEWCPGFDNTTGSASITDTAIPNSSAVLSQSPAPIETTTW